MLVKRFVFCHNSSRNFLFHVERLHRCLFMDFNLLHSESRDIPIPTRGSSDMLELEVCNLLRKYRKDATRKIELALDLHCPEVSEDVALNVLRKHRSEWKLTYAFFLWLRNNKSEFVTPSVCNAVLDLLGKMRRFEEVHVVFDEMRNREFVNEETFRILVNRYASADMVDDAIAVFDKRCELGLDVNLFGFQRLLMCLCRYKHVEVAETLLQERGNKFGVDIKTMNIVLNGWCVLNNVHEAKRFWKYILRSNLRPDLFTYGTFIKALTKKGKLGTALKLYNGMWEKGLNPDVVICNCMIDALCFKKRVPEALKIFDDMVELGCSRNVATYNTLIKHLCKIRRMEKVSTLLSEMENKGGDCTPNEVTFHFLLNSVKRASEVDEVLERMKRNGCSMSGDIYNHLLRLHSQWDCDEKLHNIWEEMKVSGFEPDLTSYTIIVHWLHNKGRFDESLKMFNEMTSIGFLPESRTKMLIDSMDKTKRGESTLLDVSKKGS